MRNVTSSEQPGRRIIAVADDAIRRHGGSRVVPVLLAVGLCILVAATVFRPLRGRAAAGPCGLTNAAFCDTFDQGPAAVRGRGGDLDPGQWSAARLAPSDFSQFGPVADPVAIAPIPACKASFPSTSVFPPNDTLICDRSGTLSPQLMTAVVVQNYGNNSYMIRQPFDFANRTGKIVFDVDAVSAGNLATYVEIDLTEDPVPAPTFREFENFESGPVPRNGLFLKWSDSCGFNSNAITLGAVLMYSNYAPSTITPSFTVTGTGCPKTRQGSPNHFEIQLSQQHIDIYGSDYSTDNGQSFPNFRRIFSANLTLPFTRSYVHVSARNHATKKYGFGPDFVYHWDNIGFDGPVLTDWRAYEVPNNNTLGVSAGTPIMNLGYLLLDGTTGKPAGIYDPVNRLASLPFQNVDLNGAVGARLTMNAYLNAITHVADTTWGWTYRFNGGTWRNRLLTPTEVQAVNTAGSAGNVLLLIDVALSDLRAGLNQLEILPVHAPMDYPPAIANIDLLLALAAGATPSAPNNLRIVP
jgi:hypothetical protein